MSMFYNKSMINLLSENVIVADNQQGRPQVLEEPSETTRQTPRVTEAYLLGALHDGTYNIGRKTHRFSQANIEWLQLLQCKLAHLGFKSWIYREGKDRTALKKRATYFLYSAYVYLRG